MNADQIVDVTNDLTPEQRKDLSDKLEVLMAKYSTIGRQSGNTYFEGVADGFNNAFKLINEIDDDYNVPGLTDEELEEIVNGDQNER